MYVRDLDYEALQSLDLRFRARVYEEVVATRQSRSVRKAALSKLREAALAFGKAEVMEIKRQAVSRFAQGDETEIDYEP